MDQISFWLKGNGNKLMLAIEELGPKKLTNERKCRHMCFFVTVCTKQPGTTQNSKLKRKRNQTK